MKMPPVRAMFLSDAVGVTYYLLCAFMWCLEDNFDNWAATAQRHRGTEAATARDTWYHDTYKMKMPVCPARVMSLPGAVGVLSYLLCATLWCFASLCIVATCTTAPADARI